MIHTVRSVVAEIQEVFNRFPQSTWRTRTQELVKMSSRDLPSSGEEEETDIEEIDQGQILSQTRDQKHRRGSRNAIEKKMK